MGSEVMVITRYIAAWGWHILGIMFFIEAIRFLIEHNYVWMIGMAGVTVFCEICAYKRKMEMLANV